PVLPPTYTSRFVTPPLTLFSWATAPPRLAHESSIVPSTCTNGLPGVQNDAACCVESCGQCGGIGCGTIPGTQGSYACCASTVLNNNEMCSVTGEAPCVINGFVATPTPTVFMSAAPVG
ncbi:unnamed protein product, partial [Choristocarpus tenellus]